MSNIELLDTPILWRQLDGPQANAIVEGGRGWFKSWCMDLINYFRTWSIGTAVGAHLDLIGLLMGIKRPVLMGNFLFDYAFKYWVTPTSTDGTGYAPVPTTYYPDHNAGILDFVDPAHRPVDTLIDMSDSLYRDLLTLLSQSKYELGSYLFLDELCNHYAGSDYTLSSAYGIYMDAVEEDIYVNITVFKPGAYIPLRGIVDSFISPFPRIFISMAAPLTGET